MARLGRTQVTYKLGRPTVVSPPVQATYVAPTRVWLARTPRQAFVVHSVLRPPATLTPRSKGYIREWLARTPRAYLRRPLSKLNAPTVVAPSLVFAPIKVELRQPPRQPFAPHSKLRPPVALGPSLVFAPIKATLARQPRQFQHASSILRPPATLATIAAAPLAAPIRLALARTPQQFRRTLSILRPPATLVPPAPPVPLATPIATKLVRQPRSAQHTLYRLNPPTVVAPQVSIIFAPISVKTTQRPAQYRKPVRHWLATPTVVAPSIVFAPISVKLARRILQAGDAHSSLRPPTVVNPFVAPVVNVLGGTDWAPIISSW